MARTFTYTFSTPANSSFTVTTGDNAGSYTIDGTAYSGYAITGITGTFNGQQITELLGPGGTLQQDTDSNGRGAAGPYDNIVFINNTQGSGGSSYGIDQYGIGFRTATTDYAVFYSNSSFGYQSNGNFNNTSTLRSSNAPCYVTGTCIRTFREGNEIDVPVEVLAVGDLAVTASGAHRPVRWIGHRRLDCTRQAVPSSVMPVRVAAHAFGENRPARDLLVSPAHAICVDLMGEVLIPAIRLVNGTTIAQVPVEHVTYWHVELDSHDILLAENLPAESYLECGNRRFFANAGVTDLAALPDARPEGPLPFCRPFHEDGAIVDFARARLGPVVAWTDWLGLRFRFSEAGGTMLSDAQWSELEPLVEACR
ncbi:Hint domain-containing protein, partial [Methylobacterium sp. J-068]|uniref:Hint domain-containing protein n=1 Tax=Methylobacterium sp. J-068 TaxID=2836649 RepID=UPI001FB86933